MVSVGERDILNEIESKYRAPQSSQGPLNKKTSSSFSLVDDRVMWYGTLPVLLDGSKVLGISAAVTNKPSLHVG